LILSKPAVPASWFEELPNGALRCPLDEVLRLKIRYADVTRVIDHFKVRNGPRLAVDVARAMVRVKG
jgi:hypothetical protein